jgi:hypothetical protein
MEVAAAEESPAEAMSVTAAKPKTKISLRAALRQRTETTEATVDTYKTQQDAEFGQPFYKLIPRNPDPKLRLPSVFHPLTRRGYGQFLYKTFRQFILEPLTDAQKLDTERCSRMMITSSAERAKIEAFPYQQFVREYLRSATPYRGLLVYHGLGSGKTCSSIAAAEALYATAGKKIVVMTPGSLRGNFQGEIQKCGFQFYRLDNHWTRQPLENPFIAAFAASVLNLTPDFIKRLRTSPDPSIWIPDTSKQPNYADLTAQEQTAIRAQLINTIESRITFINYNGITSTTLKTMACSPKNPFDDSVIVIDEVHNLTRLMASGALRKYMEPAKGRRENTYPPEPVGVDKWKPYLCSMAANYERAFLFYRLLAEAKNCKIVALSGTPIINDPDELAILINVLGGYIHTVNGTLQSTDDASKQTLARLVAEDTRLDGCFFTGGTATTGFRISIFPEGYVKVFEEGRFVGLREDETAAAQVGIREAVEALLIKARAAGLKIDDKALDYVAYPRLPPYKEDFNPAFVDRDAADVKNEIALMNRMAGFVSYYKGATEGVMPRIVEDKVVYVQLKGWALKYYQTKRTKEITEAPKGAKDPEADEKNVSSYRFNSRAACNFAFPPDIERPFRTKAEKSRMEFGAREVADVQLGEGEAAIEDLVEEEREAAVAAAEDEAAAAARGEEDEGVVPAAAPAAPAAPAAALSAIPEGPEGTVEGGGEELEPLGQDLEPLGENDYDEDFMLAEEDEEEEGQIGGQIKKTLKMSKEEAAERARAALASMGLADAATAAPPAPEPVAAPAVPKLTLGTAKKVSSTATKAAAADMLAKLGLAPTEPAAPSIKKDIEFITRTGESVRAKPAASRTAKAAPPPGAMVALNYDQRLQAALDEIHRDRAKYLSLTGVGQSNLREYSPKYAAMIEQIEQIPGTSLVYSVFKSAEGLGIFGYSLEANGYKHIKFVGSEKNLAFDEETTRSFDEDTDKTVKRYMFFTGEGSLDERKTVLNIFNGFIDRLPSKIQEVLRRNGYTDNISGQICRVIGITAAGAEGISLKGVRAVHIMEPYWNKVRTEQVKGRAVRICSHMDLPPEERTVSIFTYCCMFDPADLRTSEISETIKRNDEGKTSDQAVMAIGDRKERINTRFLDVLKRCAVDCLLNSAQNEAGIQCFGGIPGTIDEPAFDPNWRVDLENTARLRVRSAAVAATAAPQASLLGLPEEAEAEEAAETEEQPEPAEAAALAEAAPARPMPLAMTLAKAAALPAPKKRSVAKPKEADIITYKGKNYWLRPVKGQALTYTLFATDDLFGETPVGTVARNPLNPAKAKFTLFAAAPAMPTESTAE